MIKRHSCRLQYIVSVSYTHLDVYKRQVYKDASTRKREIDEMEIRIDEVVKTKEDVEALGICNGDFVAIDPKVQITESGFIKSRFLDDKISASALMGVLQHIKEHSITPAYDLIFMMSTSEEVGHGMSHICLL